MKITYEHMPPARGQRRLYAVLGDRKDIGIVWKMSGEDTWTFEGLSDGEQFSGKRRQDAVAAGLTEA